RATGSPIDSLIAVGGGSNSDYWLSALSTALNMPIARAAEGDYGAALGAARLGMMAATGAQDVATAPPIARTLEPDQNLTAAFDEGHARYAAAASAIARLT
ncbi:MAG: FGGY-family carbohydrate kinase, partial [Pseudomonadota bacterium]